MGGNQSDMRESINSFVEHAESAFTNFMKSYNEYYLPRNEELVNILQQESKIDSIKEKLGSLYHIRSFEENEDYLVFVIRQETKPYRYAKVKKMKETGELFWYSKDELDSDIQFKYLKFTDEGTSKIITEMIDMFKKNNESFNRMTSEIKGSNPGQMLISTGKIIDELFQTIELMKESTQVDSGVKESSREESTQVDSGVKESSQEESTQVDSGVKENNLY